VLIACAFSFDARTTEFDKLGAIPVPKARDRWFVPDPNKAGDLEKLREKALLKEFDAYKEVKKKLKIFRLEAVRAGFKKAWQERDYAVIVAVADKIPNNVQAVTRLGQGARGESMQVKSYKDLIVWQKAMDLVAMVYQETKRFPKEELYGLTNQLRRAAVSVPSNIVEGHARNSTAEYRNFLSMARGSLAEVETQLLIAERLKYIESEKLAELLSLQIETNKMTNALINKLAPHPSSLAPKKGGE